MTPEGGATPAALASLFGEDAEDELDLATTVVVRALWGLSQRDLVRVVGVERRRLFNRRVPVVRVLALADAREPTVEGVLSGLLHGRAPVGRVARGFAVVPDRAPAQDLRAVVASGPPPSGWLAACRRELEHVDRGAARDAYQASLHGWERACRAQAPLVEAITAAVREGLRAAAAPDGG